MFGNKKNKDKPKSPWDAVMNDEEEEILEEESIPDCNIDFVHEWKNLVGKRLYHKDYCICVLVVSAEELSEKKKNGHCQHEYTILHKGQCNVITDDDIARLWDVID
ncbi:MAG: hypothetical protein HUK25_04495 [Treponema sp.]|nr:hypothetical protein [Treponema sp.]